MKIDKLQPRMILYDRHKERMGNTTMRTLGEWRVIVLEVYPKALVPYAIVSWNGNRPERYYAHDVAKLKTWSQYDECAEVHKGSLCVYSVKLKKGYRPPPARFLPAPAVPQEKPNG